MNIRSRMEPANNLEFTSGHLYRAKKATDANAIMFCGGGFLVGLLTGNAIYDIHGPEIKPEDYEDVTNEYTLVTNNMIKGGD